MQVLHDVVNVHLAMVVALLCQPVGNLVEVLTELILQLLVDLIESALCNLRRLSPLLLTDSFTDSFFQHAAQLLTVLAETAGVLSLVRHLVDVGGHDVHHVLLLEVSHVSVVQEVQTTLFRSLHERGVADTVLALGHRLCTTILDNALGNALKLVAADLLVRLLCGSSGSIHPTLLVFCNLQAIPRTREVLVHLLQIKTRVVAVLVHLVHQLAQLLLTNAEFTSGICLVLHVCGEFSELLLV